MVGSTERIKECFGAVRCKLEDGSMSIPAAIRSRAVQIAIAYHQAIFGTAAIVRRTPECIKLLVAARLGGKREHAKDQRAAKRIETSRLISRHRISLLF